MVTLPNDQHLGPHCTTATPTAITSLEASSLEVTAHYNFHTARSYGCRHTFQIAKIRSSPKSIWLLGNDNTSPPIPTFIGIMQLHRTLHKTVEWQSSLTVPAGLLPPKAKKFRERNILQVSNSLPYNIVFQHENHIWTAHTPHLT